MHLVVFDLETTGRNVRECDIVSISAQYNGECFDSLVKPGHSIPEETTRVHGITDAMVADAPRWTVVGPAFLAWVYSRAGPNVTICAYNGCSFDVPLLMLQNARVHPKRFPPFTRVYVFDPYPVSRKIIPKPDVREGRYTQAHVYEALFGSLPEGQHTSHGDVEALTRIVEHPTMRAQVAGNVRRLSPLDGQKFLSMQPVIRVSN